jgi:2-polyprenyl-3-methyl-5-hydroxy-6-metoxy-1,4-benzoquinol methylase
VIERGITSWRFAHRKPLGPEGLGEVYGRMALEYEETSLKSELQLRAEARLLAHVTRNLEPRARLIEVGCGPGMLALGLARRGIKVVAADISEGMLEHVAHRANESGLDVPVQWIDATRDNTGLGPFDALLTVNGPLTFASDGVEVVSKLRTLLRPGAQVWLGMPRAASLEQAVRRPLRALLPSLHRRGSYVERALLKGQSIDVAIWSPRTFARRIAKWVAVEKIFAAGLTLHGSWSIDSRLGELPILRNLGAVSILYGRAV